MRKPAGWSPVDQPDVQLANRDSHPSVPPVLFCTERDKLFRTTSLNSWMCKTWTVLNCNYRNMLLYTHVRTAHLQLLSHFIPWARNLLHVLPSLSSNSWQNQEPRCPTSILRWTKIYVPKMNLIVMGAGYHPPSRIVFDVQKIVLNQHSARCARNNTGAQHIFQRDLTWNRYMKK